MKKKLSALLVICMILPVLLLAGCGGEATETTDDSVITIQISDEAKKYREEVLTLDGGDKVFLEENIYDRIIRYFNANPRQQELPECQVTNELGCEEICGCKVYTLTSKDYDNIILYTHGGGWVFGIAQEHIALCDALATKLNAKVYMPLYPLAPEADSEQTYATIENIYKELLKEEKDIYIMGDSAGGNITLGLMYTIKEENLKMPEMMVLIAPCSDMSFTNKEIEKVAKTDPVLAVYGAKTGARIWAGEENLTNPKYSAVYADVSGYPKTMIFQGTEDILGPDNLILYQNMKDAGVNVRLVKGEGLWHVFPIYPIPERDLSVELIDQFRSE